MLTVLLQGCWANNPVISCDILYTCVPVQATLPHAWVIFLPEVLGLASSSVLGSVGCGGSAIGTTRREQKFVCLETLYIPESLECYSSSSAPMFKVRSRHHNELRVIKSSIIYALELG